MRFFGTKESLEGWKKIVEARLEKACSEIVPTYFNKLEPSNIIIDKWARHHFDVELTLEEREILYNEYWHETAEFADFPWNYRISFKD